MPRAQAALCGLVLAVTLASCRTTSDDVRHWADTKEGPRKLVAVLTHDKFPWSLRAQAAVSLIGMAPRGGQRVGIDQALTALATLDEPRRDRVLSEVVPELVRQLEAPPPAPDQPDASVAFKDAAYALLSDKPPLASKPEHRHALSDALSKWVYADFERRLDARGQKVGMRELLTVLGPDSVRGLVDKYGAGTSHLAILTQLIAELGDDATKRRASERVVAIATHTASSAWREEQLGELRKANAAARVEADEQRLATQLTRFQDEELLRLFAALRQLAQAPGVEFLMAFASNPQHSESARNGALAALEGRIPQGDAAALDGLFALAGGANVPDEVRGSAFRRVAELPRASVRAPLLRLFQHEDWRVRWLAADTLLQKSQATELSEIFAALRGVEHMSLTEPLTYGRSLGAIAGVSGEMLDSYSSSSNDAAVRLTALGYYFTYGTSEQIERLSRLATDPQKVPGCRENAVQCEWLCGAHTIETVGHFVEHCVLPEMRKRANDPGAAKPSQEGQKTQ